MVFYAIEAERSLSLFDRQYKVHENMETFFKELFQYNNHFNQEIISVLTKNSERASEKCIELLSHILNAHQIWNCKFHPGQLPYGRWEIHQIQDFYEIDKKNFEQSIFHT